MNKIDLNKKIYAYIAGLLVFIFWLVIFSFKHNNVDPNITLKYENAFIITLGVILGLEFIFIKDTYYEAALFVFIPFVYAHQMDAIAIPLSLYIALGIAIIGLIVHIIRFKFKYKHGKLLFGLSVFAFSIIIGGLFVKDNIYLVKQILIMSLMSICFIFFYIFFISYKKNTSFNVISSVMNVLALLLILQVFFYFYFFDKGNESVLLAFQTKGVFVGWGVSNNIALMLLLTMPFAFYKSYKSSHLKKYLYSILLLVEYVTIIITYSRGCIFLGTIGLFIMFIVQLIKSKSEEIFVLILIWIETFILLGLLVITIDALLPEYELVNSLKEFIINGVNLETGNGRYVIYKDLLEKSKEHPILGYGMLYPFINNTYTNDAYLWGHCTYIHALYTLGIVGVITLTIHMVEKYYGCLKKMNLEKLTLFLGFLLSGLYGMIDISYFFVNYMMVIMMIFIMADDYFEAIKLGKKNAKHIK